MELKTANDIVRERARVDQRLAAVREERRAIIEASTAKRLERLEQEERELMRDQNEIGRSQNQLVAAQPLPAEDDDLRRRLLKLMADERHIFAEVGGILSARYIRADSVEYFSREVAEAQRRIDELQLALNLPGAQLGPRSRHEISELEGVVKDWEKNGKRFAAAGVEVFSLRQQQAEIREQRERLQAERERIALAV